ncbi:hypothetical protein X474_19810 [Dethiosulfatarculus sandiegensis]|uniref:Glycine zipper domain-containing protein n=2 Tax=Dethiosulfatarculus sandiegensis TaxID=1429043 RepID=A0A0D2J1K3_9BACT|nr:hypothetical protein X474_19810 [Dethiosulfatarculus sandiegensis]
MALLASLFSAGCASKGGTGALAGAGVGAIMGQAIGRNTAGTLIGTAIGTGAGYIIGNELDKAEARKRHTQGLPPETGNLAGSRWKAVKVDPMPQPPYETYVIEFGKDGWLRTTETFANGAQKTDKEHYRIKGDILIIHNPGYLINAKYTILGDRLIISSQEFTAEFTRM